MSTQKVTFGAFVLAVAVSLAACTGQGAAPKGENADGDTNGSTMNPEGPAAADVATGFTDAYGAFDAREAMTFVADDADLTGLIDSQVPADVDGLSRQLAFLEAEGYEQNVSCEPVPEATDIYVICAFDFHAIRSDQIGRGPFGGSTFSFSIRDGEIVRASLDWHTERFSPQMWEPFAEWVSTTYPADAAVMYQDETLTNFRLTRESIRLWRRRSLEYVAVATPSAVKVAQRFMENRNVHDSGSVMSLLAGGGKAWVYLSYDNAMDPDMGGSRLSRDELALALEAEQIYGVRYRNVECQPRRSGRSEGEAWVPDSANVLCTYSMDSTLRQLAGLNPTQSTAALGVRRGHVHLLNFPFLNISFPSNVPVEGWRFARWLDREHPEAGAPMVDGELFHTFGQELTLKLTPKAIDLLASYFDEYQRSVKTGP